MNEDRLAQYYTRLAKALLVFPSQDVLHLAQAIDDARVSRNTVYVMGNGGSSATASHFASDLGKGSSNDTKPRIKAYCLSDNIPAITAWANDTEYNNVFAGQLGGKIVKGDILIAISASGSSPNVVRGLAVAKEAGATCVALTGKGGGRLKEVADILIEVPDTDTERVEDMHSVVCHSVTCYLREVLL